MAGYWRCLLNASRARDRARCGGCQGKEGLGGTSRPEAPARWAHSGGSRNRQNHKVDSVVSCVARRHPSTHTPTTNTSSWLYLTFVDVETQQFQQTWALLHIALVPDGTGVPFEKKKAGYPKFSTPGLGASYAEFGPVGTAGPSPSLHLISPWPLCLSPPC